MRKLLFLLFIPFVTFSQSTDGVDICLALQSNNFTTDAEAERALTRIMNASGLAKNFALIPCDNISNAVAVSYRGERYIIYDKKFMSLISSRTNDWSNLTILAHEVGHHLNGHSIDLSMAKIVEPKSLAEKRRQELEADEFAGFIMAKLGAPLSSVLSSISLITTDDDDTYSTHPKRSRRLESLRLGYSKGQVKKSDNQTNDIYKKTSAIEKKVESKLGTTEGTWNLIDYSDDPFSEIKNSAFIEGVRVNSNFREKIVFYVNETMGKTPFGKVVYFPVIGLLNLENHISNLVNDINSSEINKFDESLRKRKNYYLVLKIDIAVDREIIGEEEIYFEDKWKFEDKLKLDIDYNFLVEEKSEIRTPIDRDGFIEKLKKGSYLFIKIKMGYSILNKWRDGYYNLVSSKKEKGKEIIFKFSLKGSSDALRWYK